MKAIFISRLALYGPFRCNFLTKAEKPLYFLITLLSSSCLVTIMKQSTLFGRPAVKRKTTKDVAEAASSDPKVAKSFCKQWLKDFQWLDVLHGLSRIE